MKRIFLLIIAMLLLTSCSESTAVNIEAFEKNVNRQFGEEIMNAENVLTQKEENDDVSYWTPEEYNVCCSLHCDPKTGIIKKYTVTSEKNNPKYEEFCSLFEKAICKNNPNINISSYEADNMIITVYEDIRYLTDEKIPTLKSEINEENLKQPVAEKTVKDEN